MIASENVVFQLPRWPRKKRFTNRDCPKRFTNRDCLNKKNTNRDCPMVTQTCRRTETLLNLGQMNGSSTSQIPASRRKKRFTNRIAANHRFPLEMFGFLKEFIDLREKILIGFQQSNDF